MRSSITLKLFLSFLALTVVVLAATLGLARWSFNRGFLDYINALDLVRLEIISEELIEHYTAAGNSWSAVTETGFRRIIRQHVPHRRKTAHAPPQDDDLQRLPPRSDRHDGNGPAQQDDNHPPRAPRDAKRTPYHRDGRKSVAGPATGLYDTDGVQIAGEILDGDSTNTINLPIILDGDTIGELRAVVIRSIGSPTDTAFSRQQYHRSALIGLFALLLAGLASWLLSRALVSPIKQLVQRVADLSKGNYAPWPPLPARHPDELTQLTGNVERLRETLESTRSARQRLLADVSHELRTPLTILTGEIQALQDGLRTFDKNQLQSLAQEVTRLSALVDDLYQLSISDIGGLRYKFTTVNVTDCISSAVQSLSPLAEKSAITIHWQATTTPAISGDRQRLNQLLTNLLSNAITYTDPPGSITIAATVTSRQLEIIIDDTAPCPPARSLEKLFDALYRDDDSRSRDTGGAGLGLALCRNIVTAHQGTIQATESAMGGLKITITLPVPAR